MSYLKLLLTVTPQVSVLQLLNSSAASTGSHQVHICQLGWAHVCTSGISSEQTSLETSESTWIISKINFKATSIFCFGEKQNEMEKLPWCLHGFTIMFSLWSSCGRFAMRKTAHKLEESYAVWKCPGNGQCRTETYLCLKIASIVVRKY